MQIQNGLSRAEQQMIIIAAVQKYAVNNTNNWANLAQVGAEIRRNGVKYGKLLGFLNSFADVLEFQQNYGHYSPVVEVRLKRDN